MWHILRTHKQQINKNKTTTNRKPNYFPAKRTVFGKWPTKGRMTKGQPNETILSISAVPGYNPPPFPLHSFLLLPHPTPLEAQLSRTFGRKTPMNHHRRSRRMNTSRLGLFSADGVLRQSRPVVPWCKRFHRSLLPPSA